MTSSRKIQHRLTASHSGSIQLDRPLEEYFAVYFKSEYEKNSCIQPVARILINIPVLINLFRRYNDDKALELTNDDIKLIQIIVIFSTINCLDEKDKENNFFDEKAANNLYLYLKDKLKVAPDKSAFLTEAIVNRRSNPENYYKLIKISFHRSHWVKKKSNPTIYDKIIHDSYYLNNLEKKPGTVNHFRANNLYFYKQIARSNSKAFNEMAKLITEARSFIELHRTTFNKEDGFPFAFNSIREHFIFYKETYQIYSILYANNTIFIDNNLEKSLLIDYSSLTYTYKSITEESLTIAMHNGHLFARAISAPAAISTFRTKDDEQTAALEIRKILRRPGNPTNTKKKKSATKKWKP